MIRLINPVEAAVGFAATVGGVSGILTGSQSYGTLATIWPPGWMATVYYTCLALGGLLIMAGMSLSYNLPTHERVTVWRIGLFLTALTWGPYGVALLVVGSGAATFAGIVFMAIAVSLAARFAQLRRTE